LLLLLLLLYLLLDCIIVAQVALKNNIMKSFCPSGHIVRSKKFFIKFEMKNIYIFYLRIWKIFIMGGCKLMMVSHDMLVAMQTWKNNNMLTWRDYSRCFYNEFEYGGVCTKFVDEKVARGSTGMLNP
jgi:hypothetical protein